MSNFKNTADTCENEFNTRVVAPEALNVQWPNADDIDKGDDLWVAWSVQEGDSKTSEIGGTATRYRDMGSMIVQIFVPLKKGTGDALALADTIAGSFRNVTYSGVRFRVARVTRVGVRGKWYQVNVVCPFHRDGT